MIRQLSKKDRELVRQAVKLGIDLLTTDAYFRQYYALCADLTAREAFDEIEAIVLDLTGQNRYAEYDYFRRGRSRYINRFVRLRRSNLPQIKRF